MKRLKEKGFTLIEVIIAMTLVGIIAVSFIPLISAQYVNIYTTGNKSKATYNALDITEEETIEEEKKSDTINEADAEDIIIKFEGKDDITEYVKPIKKTGEEKGSTTDINVGIPKEIKTPVIP